MLLPTEQAFGQAATGLLQSMLDQIEERRKEQEEKRVGKTANDPMVEARITASEEARRSRENIAEAFFNGGTKSITEQKIELMDQLGKKLGINRDDYRSSYGYGKATVLAALGNALLLIFACGAIAFEAIRRLAEPAPVASSASCIAASTSAFWPMPR